MKIINILKKSSKGFSFEFFPPKTDKAKIALAHTVDALLAYNPLYASMTYGAGGGAQENTKEAVSMLLSKKVLEVMPHLTCIGAKKDVIKGILDGYKAVGVENIMALRGDPPQGSNDSFLSGNDFACARDLVRFIRDYGTFCVGVAVYPEGHIETSSLDQDLEYTKKKIDAGADFAVTQMFFDNNYYYSLLERMRKKGISIPVLPGILPLTDVEKVKQFASICRATIPANICEKMENLRENPSDMEKAGIEFTIKQCRQLISQGVTKLHFFTLNKPQVITAILEAIK